LSRTFIHNLTAEGTPALPEWPFMFSVLINGLAFVPADYTTNSTLSDKGDNERAWAYVEIYLKAYRLFSLSGRRISVTEKGRFATSSQYTYSQASCTPSFPLISPRLYRLQISLFPNDTDCLMILSTRVSNIVYALYQAAECLSL
jgi:hypothetical protein